MQFNRLKFMLPITFLCLNVVWEIVCIEPLTMFGAAVIGGFIAGWSAIKCPFYECCDNSWIPQNMTKLKESLREDVFGQHIASDVILKQLLSHVKDPNPAKPLVMSFHGWTGGGKNHIASLIANSTYFKGMKSKYVHHFMATNDFPHPSLSASYGDQLRNWVLGNVSECARSLFVFDEMDKMPPGVIDSIRSYLDYNENVRGVDFRKSIFIILSNTGGKNITEKMFRTWTSGVKREDLRYRDFENLILLGAFNEPGGLQKSNVIERSLIDLYVPFLPLERRHVRMCAKREFQRRGVVNPSEKALNAVADAVDYCTLNETIDSDEDKSRNVELYSKTGCKKVSAIVGRYLANEQYGRLFED